MSNSRMNARERINYLLEDHSFVELGNLISARSTNYNLGSHKESGDGVVTGYGILKGRMVYVYSQDASVLGGSIGEMHGKKITAVYDLAMKTGAPVIGMLDCAGLRLQEATDALHAFGSIFRKQVQASGMIPQITAIFGMCGGGCAAVSALSDFTLMEREHGQLFVNSPNTLGDTRGKIDNAAADYQAEKAGSVDFVCDSEEELLTRLGMLVDYLPSNYREGDINVVCKDDLNRVIPELNDAEYDPRYLLSSIADQGSFLETRAMYAEEMVTGFIRLNGQTVGAVANQNLEEDPVLTTRGMHKAQRFVRFCDAFNIPLLTVTDAVGLRPALHGESRQAQALAGMIRAFADSTVPKVNLIAGRAFGTAGIAMNSKAIGADFVLAWPRARVGMMDPEQAVRIIYAREIAASSVQPELIREKTEEYSALQGSAQAAAERGYVDDIIVPDATRKRLIAAFLMLYGKKQPVSEKKHSAI